MLELTLEGLAFLADRTASSAFEEVFVRLSEPFKTKVKKRRQKLVMMSR